MSNISGKGWIVPQIDVIEFHTGRPLARNPDATVVAKALSCMHCRTALTDADQVLHDLYDKVDLPPVRPVVTRVERYVGHCPCCDQVSLAPVPEGLEPGTPFSVNSRCLGDRKPRGMTPWVFLIGFRPFDSGVGSYSDTSRGRAAVR